MFVFSCIGPHAEFAFDVFMLLLRRPRRRRRPDLLRLVPLVLLADVLSFCIVVLELLFCAETTNSAPTKTKAEINKNSRVMKLLMLLLLTIVSPPASRAFPKKHAPAPKLNNSRQLP